MFKQRSLLLCIMLMLFGCGGGGGGGSALNGTQSAGSGANDPGVNTIQDNGDIDVVFGSSTIVSNPASIIGEEFSEAQLEETINNWVDLPKGDVTIVFQDCGEAGISYSSADSKITVCYELLGSIYIYYFALVGPSQITEYTASVFTYLLGYEMGKVMIDQFDTTLIGSEQDTADLIAVAAALRFDKSAAAILAADYILHSPLTSWQNDNGNDVLRFNNPVCWTVGNDPALLGDAIMGNLAAPLYDGSRDCQSEYQSQSASLDQFLSPYIKENVQG